MECHQKKQYRTHGDPEEKRVERVFKKMMEIIFHSLKFPHPGEPWTSKVIKLIDHLLILVKNHPLQDAL